MRKIILIAAAALLGGCANAGYVMQTYGDKPHDTLETPHGTYWVWDRPALGKILTSPSPGQAAGLGMVSGLTLGIAKIDPTVQAHQDVVRQWFREQNRNCEIKTSAEILRPEFEHTYACK